MRITDALSTRHCTMFRGKFGDGRMAERGIRHHERDQARVGHGAAPNFTGENRLKGA
jgi:hypothetical protein